MIKLIEVTNPLQPSVDRIDRELEYVDGQHLDTYLAKAFEASLDLKVSVNGRMIAFDLWWATTPRDGDCIVVVPTVGSPGLAKTLGALAITAASIALIATGVGAPLGAALGVSTIVANGILGAAVSVAGGLVLGAIVSALTPSQKSQTPSYAFDGPHSLAQSGTVIPKGYGTFQWGGNIIASFIDIEGEDQYINCLVCYGFGPARSITGLQLNGKDVEEYNNVQYYTRLGSNTQTPIPNFNRIVNGFPQDTQCLAGIPVIVPGTGDLVQILQVDIQFPDGVFHLTNDGNIIGEVVTYTVEYSVSGAADWQPVLMPDTTMDIITFNILTGDPNPFNIWSLVATDLPPNSGVVYATDNGPHNAGDVETVSLTIETFQANGNHSTSSHTFTGEWQLTNPLINQVQVLTWRAGFQDFVGFQNVPLYNRTTIYGLAPNKYDIRVTKFGSANLHDDVTPGDNFAPNVGQDMWVHSVNEIVLLDLAYPNMILVGVRALATSQLSGSNVNITAVIEHGLRTLDNDILPGALQSFEEDNPACVAADMALDPLYGGGQFPGISTANIDRFIDEWVAWADMNDELVDDGNGGSLRRHVFNGVFDDESDLWTQMGKVGKMSRAQPIPIGRDYGVFVDRADDPVQIFTMGNIVQDSFTETWMDIDDRANQTEIQFADRTRFYKQDNPMVYMDPALQDAGVPIKNVRIDGKGITIPAQAWHLARVKARGNQFLLRTGSFKCDADAVACRPGNVCILQHDIPQWGFGGRTLPGSTATKLIPDRSDIVFLSGTSYNVIVLHAAVQRYTGTTGAVSEVIDTQGANVGTKVVLTAFDNANRVTRLIVAGLDYQVLSSDVGFVIIQPSALPTPTSGQPYTLFDTDVLDTVPVSAQNVDGSLTLGTPLIQAPDDYSTYFYGPVGSQKLIRIVNIRKASEYRATIEWIDYDPQVYTDATPIVGETSAQVTSQPGVNNLIGAEIFDRVGGTYVTYAKLSWKLGRDTVGVGVYGWVIGSNVTNNAGQPQMLARLTNYATSFQIQVNPGDTWVFVVVGFDQQNNYAAFGSAPRATIAAVGIATNLLLGSSFATGFTYWNITPRAGDTLVPSFADDGEAIYTVAGTPLTVPQALVTQVIPPSKWAIGDFLMLSAFFEDSCVSSLAPNVGGFFAQINFLDVSDTLISSVLAEVPLSGITPTVTRCNTVSTAIPSGTASVIVQVILGAAGLSIPVGSIMTLSHLLLESSPTVQSEPSAWADIDVMGQVLDIFTSGSSTGLRAQASVLPSFTGGLAFAFTDTTVTASWTNLVILWPDGAVTYVQNGSLAVTGLTASTLYFAWFYFDIVFGGVAAVVPAGGVGSPAIMLTAYSAIADAAAKQDGRVALTLGGLQVTTTASGGSGSGSGGGGGPVGPDGGDPVGGRSPVFD